MSRLSPVAAGVVGHPIDHSLSPLIHGAWLGALGLNGVYAAFGPGTEAGFLALVHAGRDGALLGLNVTAPFKEAALALADRASDTARAAGSANLLLFRDGRILADSTDGRGVTVALSEQAPALDLTAGPSVVLGAGGAARAAVQALAAAGAPQVRIVNRTRARAEGLARHFGGVVVPADAEDALDDQVALVLDATAGAPPPDLSRLGGGAVVMDMGYRPLLTPILAAARARGLTTVDGLAMLIGQARPSFEALFGVRAPDLDVRALCLAALGEARA